MRTTIIIEDALYEKFKSLASKRKLSEFINQLLREKLEEEENKALSQKMKEGYLATRRERKSLNEDWDSILAEDWE
jgi:metal-responsive CopG/Arc/MetJ family transcriptional regulator